MGEELKRELQKHIQERVLDFAGHDVDSDDLDEIVENIENDVNKRIDEYITAVNEI